MFKKEDIKPGYLLEIEKGFEKYLAIVTYGDEGHLCYSSKHTWAPISDLSDDLYNSFLKSSKVTKVYGYAPNCYAYMLDTYRRPLLWERREPKEMTVADIEKLLGYPVKIVK